MLRWHNWLIPAVVALFFLFATACGSTEDPTPQPTPTPVDVSGIVQQAISDALAAQTPGAAGISADDVAKAVQAAMATQPGVTSADVASAIAKALADQPGISSADVAGAISKALADQPGITPEEVSAAIAKAMADLPEGITQADIDAAIGRALIAGVPTATPVPGEPTPSGPKRGGTLPLHMNVGPETVYVLGSGTTYGANLHLAGLVNQIVEYDPETADTLDIRGDLAESWTVSPDARTYTFKIREGVRFHNGDLLTMDDIMFSLTSRISPKDSEFEIVKEETNEVPSGGGQKMAAFIEDFARDWTALDEHTLEVKLSQPGPFFLNLFGENRFPILQRKFAVEGKLHKFAFPETLNGTGPYKLAKYERDVATRWERNDQYWKPDTPWLDGVDAFIVIDKGTIAAAYKTRQLLMTATLNTGLSVVEALQLEKELGDQATVTYAGPSWVTGFIMNADIKPWDDPRARKAMNLIVHRQPMIQVLSEGGYVLGSPIPCGYTWSFSCDEVLNMPGYRELNGEKHPDDIAEAKKLFLELGMVPGTKVSIGCQQVVDYCAEAIMMKQQVTEHLGWDVTVNSVEFNVGNTQMDSRDYQIFMIASSASPPIPDVSVGNYSKGNRDHLTRTGVYNAEADKLWSELRSTPDVARQRELSLMVNNLLLEDNSHPNLWYVMQAFIVDKAVQGVHVPGVLTTYSKWDHIWCDPVC